MPYSQRNPKLRIAKAGLVEDFEELDDVQISLHAIDALECAFAAVAILDERTSGAPQHIACLLAGELQRTLEAAERMRDLYELR